MKYKIGLILMLWVLLFIPQVSVASDAEHVDTKQYLGITTRAYIADELLNLANISEYMNEENLVTSNSIIAKIGGDGVIKIHHKEGETGYALEVGINAVSENQYGVMWKVIKKTSSSEKIYGSSDGEYQLQQVGKPLVFSVELGGNQMIFDLVTKVDTEANLIKMFAKEN